MKKILILSFCISLLLAQGLSQKIVLPRGILILRLPGDSQSDSVFRQSAFFENQYFFAAYFTHLPNSETLSLMQSQGFSIEERLASNIYLVKSSRIPSLAYCRQFGISGVSAIPVGLKIDPRLLENIPGYALQPDGKVKTLVSTFKEMDSGKMLKTIQQSGFEYTDTKWVGSGIISGNIHSQDVERLLALPFVTSIQLQNPPEKTLNNIGRGSSGTALLNAPVLQGGKGLDGSGVTVGVGDDADPTLHPDVFDRIINHTPGIPSNHGTHVTGTVAGAGIISPKRAGFAPGATVVSQWFSGIWDNAATYTSAYNMVATNNSYGSITGDCVYAGVYDLYSRMLDLQAFDYPQLLHAFAAGNDGDNTCSPFPKSYNTVLGSYQSAKNIITVGRTDYTQITSSSSSSGPVKDGRLKPEITGLGIISSLNGGGTGYTTGFGTSNSAPNITGGLTLLYQRYKQLNGGVNPQGALMKALLLNGARDVGAAGPDYRHGYGTMMLERSLKMLENKWFTERSIAQAQVQDTVISVPANTALLKVMLYWHDPAAAVLATNTLVHDLDLELIDPGGQTILPQILNPSPGSVTEVSAEGADHINNHEQVLIANPAPGNYTIRVKGTEILTAPQQPYVVTFNYVPVELRFTNPLQGTVVESNIADFPIAWEDEGNAPGTYTLSYSLDDGGNWTEIISGLKDSTRLFFWQPGNIRSTNARLQISKGGLTSISERFSIIPNVAFSLAANNDQCYSYFRLNWTALTPAEGETIDYVVLLKKGVAMDSIATVTGQNFFIIPNLNPDSTYYAAVVARLNGVKGTYASAATRRPNAGNCNGAISDGNLMMDSILSPLNGRYLTSSAPGSNAPVMVRMRNLDNVVTSGFSLKYSINGGSFTEAIINTPVAARATFTHSFPGIDLSAPGTYLVTAIVTNTGAVDPIPSNDTLRSVINVLPNDALTLAAPFTEDFETAGNYAIQKSQTGLSGLTRWDYINEDPLARLRTFVVPGIAQSGNNAITLDITKAPPRIINPFNQFIGTFNLAGLNANSQEVRLDFSFKHHGSSQVPHELNKVWIRGNDTEPWIEIYDLGVNQTALSGYWKQVPAIDLSDALKKAGSQFSTSTQIRFGQYARYSMADNSNFAGYSFDDIRLLLATNDVELLSIKNPSTQNCDFGSPMPVTIKVVNGMTAALNNIPVRYRVNNGAWVNEIIPTIAAKDTIEFTFSTMVSMAASSKNSIEAETGLAGDNIPGNNRQTILALAQAVVSTYPYYQDFEGGEAGFMAEGINNTWELGAPASLLINTAASGQKAWKTRLTGDYSNNELSYLYTPCFNIASLNKPMLGFHIAYSFEDCRTSNIICDAGWMEYSLDGLSWQKLGQYGEGENWYDYETGQVWMASDKTNWAEAIIPLPKHNGTIRLRFVMKSDGGTTREGLAIDNFQVFNGDALPLEWLWFEAQKLPGESVLLQWRVPNRQAGETFTIEVNRTANEMNGWLPLGSVPVVPGDGGRYMFTDHNTVKSGSLYYRVTWHKRNGEHSVSPVRTIQFGAPTNQLLVYPNPASQHLQVQAHLNDDEPVTLRLVSTLGRIMYQAKVNPVNGWLTTTLNLKQMALPPGVYVVEIQGKNGRQVRTFLKE